MSNADVTVGVCAYGDERNLAALLKNVLDQQSLPESSEVLVVCSECAKETVDALEPLALDKRLNVWFENRRTGKAAAINRILSDAKGDFIIFVSADALPADGCFQKLLANMKDGVGIACGKPVPIETSRHTTGRLVQLLWRFHHRMFTYLNHAELLTHASEVYCIRRAVAKSIPDNAVNDDAYLAVLVRRNGWRIAYEPSAQVVMRGPDNLFDYFEQRRRIVFGHYQVRRLTGRFPQYLAYWALLRPTKILRLVLEEIRDERRLKTIAIAFILELLINAAGIFDFLRGKSHVPWRIIHSTKGPLTQEVSTAKEQVKTGRTASRRMAKR